MQIDPRGPRFAAVLTTLVLAAVLISGSGLLLAAQAASSRSARSPGSTYSPYGWLYRTAAPAAPRAAERDWRTPARRASPRVSASASPLVGTVGYLTGCTWLGLVATAFALAAAFLNAAFGYCLGCELYLCSSRRPPRGNPHRHPGRLTGRAGHALVPAATSR